MKHTAYTFILATLFSANSFASVAYAQSAPPVYIPTAEKDRIARVGGGYQQQAQPMGPALPHYRSPNYIATAAHPDANGLWIGTWYQSPDAARQEVMRECEKAMGSPCQPAAYGHSGWLVVARDNEGGLWSFIDASKGKAKKRIKEDCKARNVKCSFIQEAKAPAFYEFVGVANMIMGKVTPPPGDYRRK